MRQPASTNRSASAPPARSRRRRWLIRLGWLAGVLIVLILVANLLADRYVNRRFQGELTELLPALEARTGLRWQAGSAGVGLDGSGILRDVIAAAPGGAAVEPLFQAGQIEANYAIDWRAKAATITEIHLRRPRFAVRLDRGGAPVLPATLRDWLNGAKRQGKAGQALPDQLRLGDFTVRIAEPLAVRLHDGELLVRGAAAAGTSDLLAHLNAIDGVVSLERTAKRLLMAGEAKEAQHGGRLGFDAAVEARTLRTTLRFDELPLGFLAGRVPEFVKLNSTARLNGQLTAERSKPGDLWRAGTELRLSGLTLAHPRLAAAEVTEVSGRLRGALVFDAATRTLDSADLEVRVGDAPVHLRDLRVRWPANGPFALQTKIETDGLPLQKILDGLPRQLIPAVHGLRVEGALHLRASLVLDMGNPSRSGLDSDGEVTGFKVVSAPAAVDVRRIARPDFVHQARKKGVPQKTIVVGPTSEDFVPLNAVGGYVRGAVLTCEDGSFFRHNGFMLRHINDSLRRDLREKRFARGASTVSMQLVKNLFLTEEKTLSRKLQEVLLTWWMEQEIEKERILEVYLNVIEWGPQIYGIGPASRHYFHCHPSKVLPIQAAFLASIIANPVRYHYMKQRGYVGDGWRTVLSFVMQKMVERGTISQEDWDLAAANNFEVPFTYLAAMPRPEPVEPTPAPADASPEPPPEMPDFPD